MDQITPQGFAPEDEKNNVVVPERRNIPETARAEVISLFNVYLADAKKADTSRSAFVAFLQTVRQQLGIPDNEIWNVSDEATYFEKAGPVSTENFTAVPESALPTAGVPCANQ